MVHSSDGFHEVERLLSPDEIHLYRRLIVSGRVTETELGVAVAGGLASLAKVGLIERHGGAVEAVSPFAAIHAMVRESSDALVRARATGEELERAWADRPELSSSTEILSGAASDDAFERLVDEAKHVWSMHKKWADTEPGAAPQVAYDVLARGTTIQVVYDSSLLTDSVALGAARSCVAAGEQARVLPGVPLSMTLSETVGVIALPTSRDGILDRLLVRSPALLEQLKSVFDALWDKAAPIAASSDDMGEEENRAMLSLLAFGLTDQAIGRELGISERTVRRRITALQTLLGAQTRFQLGAQASRQGWLDS